jgi:hypothetical protein
MGQIPRRRDWSDVESHGANNSALICIACHQRLGLLTGWRFLPPRPGPARNDATTKRAAPSQSSCKRVCEDRTTGGRRLLH